MEELKIVREAWEEHNLIKGLIQEMDDETVGEKVWESSIWASVSRQRIKRRSLTALSV